MKLYFTKSRKTLLVNIDGDIDHHTCEKLRIETERALTRSGSKNVLFLFENVSFMDSSGIGALIGRYKVVKRLGGGIAIAGANDVLKRIFVISAIQSLIPTFSSKEDALEYLEGESF